MNPACPPISGSWLCWSLPGKWIASSFGTPTPGMGRQSGLNDSLVNNLRDKQELAGLSAEESAVVDYGREFFRTHRVSQSTFDRGLSLLGMQGLIEIDQPHGVLFLPRL